MQTTSASRHMAMPGIIIILLLSALSVRAQNCDLPAFPTGSMTATQDRDRMLCLLGIRLPVLPPRIDDPNRPPNAFPRDPANPEGNWTDQLGHTIVRTAFGQWHTYDSYTYDTDFATRLTGGAIAPFGDYGPFSHPRYTDIELLKMKNGTTVLSPEDWWIKRRPEILKDVQDNLYGHIPDRSLWPAITWSVSAPTTGTQIAVNGIAYQFTQKVVTGTIDTSGYPEIRNAPRIVATCRTPPDRAGTKIPVIVVFGGVNAFQYTAPYGYGVCGFSQGQLQPDSGGANLSSYLIGLINKGNWRKPDDWGALAAWSWGISRLIDYFETDPDIDATRVGLEGHSRFGKATLVTAAYDDRIVIALPSCAGALGTSWARRAYGETLEFVASSTSEYHWVAGTIMKYGGELNPGTFWPRKVEILPVDAHSVMSLIAPRAVITNGGTDTPPGFGDAWQDPRGMYLAAAVSSSVWNLLGWRGLIIPEGTVFTSGPAESAGGTPPFNAAFIEGTVGWRRHSQGHTDQPTWPSFVEMASRYFNDNRPVISPAQSFILGDHPVNALGSVQAMDADDGDVLGNWQIKGGNGAYKFAIDRSSGRITIADAASLDFVDTASYTLTVMVGDGKLASKDEVVTIIVPGKINVCHKGKNDISISKHDVPDHLKHGDSVGRCAITERVVRSATADSQK